MPEPSSKRRRAASGKQARAMLLPTPADRRKRAQPVTPEIDAVAAGVPIISPEREYAYIREDLRRLLTTAAILIAVMIGLLMLIDQ